MITGLMRRMGVAFRVTQMSGDLTDYSTANLLWTPTDTFLVRADRIRRDDFLAMDPRHVRVLWVVPFGTQQVQVLTTDGLMMIRSGLMVMINRDGGMDNV